jgi:hypothetical protein
VAITTWSDGARQFERESSFWKVNVKPGKPLCVSWPNVYVISFQQPYQWSHSVSTSAIRRMLAIVALSAGTHRPAHRAYVKDDVRPTSCAVITPRQ